MGQPLTAPPEATTTSCPTCALQAHKSEYMALYSPTSHNPEPALLAHVSSPHTNAQQSPPQQQQHPPPPREQEQQQAHHPQQQQQQKYGRLMHVLSSLLTRKSRKHGADDAAAKKNLVAQLYGQAQLSEFDHQLLSQHFERLPSSYAAAGHSVQQLKHHMALLAKAATLKEGVTAMRFDIRDEEDTSARDASTSDSSCSSSAGGFSSFSDAGGASAVCRVDVSFACGTHLCRPALAAGFRQAGMSVVSLSVWDTTPANGTLGTASLRVCRDEFSKQQLEEVFASVSSSRGAGPGGGGGGGGTGVGFVSRSSTLSSSMRSSALGEHFSSFLGGSSSSGRLSPWPQCTSLSEHGSRDNSKRASPLHPSFHRRTPTVSDTDASGTDMAEGLLKVLLSEKGHMKKELGKFVLDPLKLEMGSVIAVGSSGEVRRGTYDGEPVAVKVLKAKQSQAVVAEFRREVFTLMACGESPHLLKFLGICVDVRSRMCIVTRFMEGGTLHDFLQRRGGEKLPLPLVLSLARDIASGMEFLHRNGMLHRDLKSANVLLDGEGRAVVGDFGVARLKGERGEITKEVGTYRWMAPEAFGTSAWPVTNKSDVYSYGIVLWELVSLALPFENYSPLQAAVAVTLNGLRPPIPDDCPEGMKQLIEKCWAKDPKDRPDFEQVLAELKALSSSLL